MNEFLQVFLSSLKNVFAAAHIFYVKMGNPWMTW